MENGNTPWRRQERGGGIQGDGRTHLEKVERGCTVHIYDIYSGPVLEDVENTRGAGGYAVVGVDGNRLGRGQGDSVGGDGSG